MTMTGSGAAGYATVATHLFFSMVKIMITMMLVVLLVARLHVHIFDATNMLLIYFWIKLIYIEFNKFSNNPKTYRYFLVAGFVNALKQIVFAIFLLNLD
jgi:flagellar biosynthesis protein FlhB